jgi:uncharacterized membrane protein YczE
VLAGQFAMRLTVRLFIVIWLGLIGVFIADTIPKLLTSPDQLLLKSLFIVVPVAMAGAGMGIVHFGWRTTRGDIEFMTREIQKALHQHGT